MDYVTQKSKGTFAWNVAHNHRHIEHHFIVICYFFIFILKNYFKTIERKHIIVLIHLLSATYKCLSLIVKTITLYQSIPMIIISTNIIHLTKDMLHFDQIKYSFLLLCFSFHEDHITYYFSSHAFPLWCGNKLHCNFIC